MRKSWCLSLYASLLGINSAHYDAAGCLNMWRSKIRIWDYFRYSVNPFIVMQVGTWIRTLEKCVKQYLFAVISSDIVFFLYFPQLIRRHYVYGPMHTLFPLQLLSYTRQAELSMIVCSCCLANRTTNSMNNTQERDHDFLPFWPKPTSWEVIEYRIIPLYNSDKHVKREGRDFCQGKWADSKYKKHNSFWA